MAASPTFTPEDLSQAILNAKALIAVQERDETAATCTANFRKFVEKAWSIVEPARAFVPNWHIDAICDHLQGVTDGHIQNLLINVAPGTAKSLLVSVLWHPWIWLKSPKWRGFFSSYSGDLVIRDAVRARTLLESPWYQQTFQPPWQFSEVQNAKNHYENTLSGSRFSTSLEGKGTGFRGDTIVCDDPLNAREQASPAKIEDCIFVWDQVYSSRLNDMATGSKVIIMQRLHEQDLSGHVIPKGYTHLRLPTEFEPQNRCVTVWGNGHKWTDPRHEEKELMFPQLFPRHVVDEAKVNLGSAGFAGQHQQRPTPAGGLILLRHWWQYWQPAGANLPPVTVTLPDGNLELREAKIIPAKFDEILQSWDMSFVESKDSSFVAGLILSGVGADRYVLDSEHERMDLPKTLTAVRRLSGRWPGALTKLVEMKANGPAVVQSLKHEIGGFIGVDPDGSKEARAAAATPMLEAGNWYVPHPALFPWVLDFIAELAAFPRGANNDWVDAWTQGAKRLLKLKKKIPPAPPDNPGMPFAGDGGGPDRSWMGL